MSPAGYSYQLHLSLPEQLHCRWVHRRHHGEPALPLAGSCHPPRSVPQGLGHCPARPQTLCRPQPRAEGCSEAQAAGATRVRRARAQPQGWGILAKRSPALALMLSKLRVCSSGWFDPYIYSGNVTFFLLASDSLQSENRGSCSSGLTWLSPNILACRKGSSFGKIALCKCKEVVVLLLLWNNNNDNDWSTGSSGQVRCSLGEIKPFFPM